MTIRYVRVKNRSTGHEYDVLEQQVDHDKHEVLDQDRYPIVGRPRPAKPRVGKGGGSAELTARSSRPRLEAAAKSVGVDPADFTNKQQIFDAIVAAKSTPNE